MASRLPDPGVESYGEAPPPLPFLGKEGAAGGKEGAIAEAFKADERFLWGLCYRLTGIAADADDLVQETFVRAIERPPAQTGEAWRPWLVRVALNLGRDLLRRRRRRRYAGPWLPTPIETGDEAALAAYEPTVAAGQTTEGRYDLLESVSFAFLIALEALTPQQRAVLLLRDVFDYTVRETSDALGLSEANVKTTHHRARRAMHAYDRSRCVPTRRLQEQTRHALERLVTGLSSGDIHAVESVLADGVRALSDGGGEFAAAMAPVVGRRRVGRLYLGLAGKRPAGTMEVRMLNGLPAVIVSFAAPPAGVPSHLLPRLAPRLVIRCDVDDGGRIIVLHSVLATRKLSALRFAASS